MKRLTARTPWTAAEEITFECEPGTITDSKLSAIRQMGVTRLSLTPLYDALGKFAKREARAEISATTA